MWWRPKAPTIDLKVPGPIRVGEAWTGAVVVGCEIGLAVQSIDVHIEGIERFTLLTEDCQQPMVALGVRVTGPRELSPGLTELPFRVVLARGLSASHAGRLCTIAYSATVSLIDGSGRTTRARFDLQVRAALTIVGQNPLIASTDPEGSNSDEPTLELALGSDTVCPNQNVLGVVVLWGNWPEGDVEASLSFVAFEKLHGARGRTTERTLSRHDIELSTEQRLSARQLTFVLRVPDDATLSFEHNGMAGVLAVHSLLELNVSVRSCKRSLAVPIRVFARPTGEVLDASSVPEAGESRRTRLLEQVGRAHGMTLQSGSLSKRIDALEIVFRRDESPSAWLAELRYPSLGLDAHLELDSSILAVDPRAHWLEHLRARDTAQTMNVLLLLEADLMPFCLRSFTDNVLCVSPLEGGQSRIALERMMAALDRLARSLLGTHQNLPPPSAMTDEVEVWQELAVSVQGTLSTATMMVRGHIASTPVEVATLFDGNGKPHAIRVTAGTKTNDALAQWTPQLGAPEAVIPRLSPGEHSPMLVTLSTDAIEMQWGTGCIEATFPGTLKPARIDLARHVRTMVRVLPYFRSRQSPYR